MVIAFNMEQFVSSHLKHLNFIIFSLSRFVDTFSAIDSDIDIVDVIHFRVGDVRSRMVIGISR